MNQLQVFSNSEFGKIQTVTINNEPWFIGMDIAAALGYAQTNNMRKVIGADDIRSIDPQNPDFSGIMLSGVSENVHNILVINESGLYSAIFGSTLPNAKKFKKWVTSEVLPSIRKTGSYQLPQDTRGQLRLLMQANEETNQRIDKIESDFASFREDLPLFPTELEKIVKAVKKKGMDIVGGKESLAYLSCYRAVVRDIYAEIWRNFDVTSYKDVKRCDLERVAMMISSYTPPIFLADKISADNMEVAA